MITRINAVKVQNNKWVRHHRRWLVNIISKTSRDKDFDYFSWLWLLFMTVKALGGKLLIQWSIHFTRLLGGSGHYLNTSMALANLYDEFSYESLLIMISQGFCHSWYYMTLLRACNGINYLSGINLAVLLLILDVSQSYLAVPYLPHSSD